MTHTIQSVPAQWLQLFFYRVSAVLEFKSLLLFGGSSAAEQNDGW